MILTAERLIAAGANNPSRAANVFFGSKESAGETEKLCLRLRYGPINAVETFGRGQEWVR
jgi:hypothetical protein